MVVGRGRGYEIEDMNQTLGRGTFNGRDVLEANDVLHVTVLTTAEDLVFARKYPMSSFHLSRWTVGIPASVPSPERMRKYRIAPMFSVTKGRKVGLGSGHPLSESRKKRIP